MLPTAAAALVAALLVAAVPAAATAAADPPPGPTTAEVLEASKPSDWRGLDPDETVYFELPAGRVVIELAPEFAPEHVANVKRLVRQGYFDGLAVVRSQDNYVVQWGDPRAGEEERARGFGEAKRSLRAELDRPIDRGGSEGGGELPFTPLGDGDVYAPEVGFSHGFPAARDPETGRTWLLHCYGMVGAGRDLAPGSGSGAELYAVIGHAPRHLDRNVTLLGRVVDGMEVLSTLPRGSGPLGFYEDPAEHVPIERARLGSQLPPAERADLELLRTDTETFEALIESRRHRREEWFLDPVGRVEVCNVPLPVREAPATPGGGPAGGVAGR